MILDLGPSSLEISRWALVWATSAGGTLSPCLVSLLVVNAVGGFSLLS